MHKFAVKLCCIARCKNEIGIINEWLNSMPFVDLFCIVDNGSTDGTYEILKNHPKVIVTQTLGFHEGRDLNLVLDIAKAHNPEWILKLDCDEIFEDLAVSNFDVLLNQKKYNSFYFRKFSFDYRVGSENFRYDGDFSLTVKNPEIKLTRMNTDLVYPNIKSHVGDMLFYSWPVAFSNFRIKHHIIYSDKKSKEKYVNYMKIKEKKDKTNFDIFVDGVDDTGNNVEVYPFLEPEASAKIIPFENYGLPQFLFLDGYISIKGCKFSKKTFFHTLKKLIYLFLSIIPLGKKLFLTFIEKKMSRS